MKKIYKYDTNYLLKQLRLNLLLNEQDLYMKLIGMPESLLRGITLIIRDSLDG